MALCAFLGAIKFKQYRAQSLVEKEKQKLSGQTRALEEKNKQLADSLAYLNSSNFKERVARQQLNLKKEGELIYSFKDSAAPADNPPALSLSGQSNFQRWLNYFFSNSAGQ